MNYKVCVICWTYNHNKYIENALNGFCIQKTNFPFVCSIVDDASTDGNQQIIEEYVKKHFDLNEIGITKIEERKFYHLVFARHKNNKNCFFAVLFLKENHYLKKSKLPYIKEWTENSKYIAFCEGDDYWTDPLKLQKQADGLEKNPQCSFSINKVNTVNREGQLFNSTIPTNRFDSKKILSIEDYMDSEFVHGQWTFQLSGCMMRTEINHYYKKYLDTIFKKFPYGDIPLFLTAFLHGDCYYISTPCGCYRRMSGGFTSSIDKDYKKRIMFAKEIIEGYKEFEKYTDYKYHRYIKYAILRKEFKIAKFSKSRKELFKPKYLPLYQVDGIKNSLSTILQSFFPSLYNLLKKSR